MTAGQLTLIGVAVVLIAAAAAAFVIVWRRSVGDWRQSVEPEAVAADLAAPAPAVTVPAAEAEAEAEAQPEEAPEPVVTVASTQRLVEVSAEEAGITRRTFFNRALSTTFGTFLGVLALDILAFMWPKVTGGFGAKVTVGAPTDLLAQATNADGSVTPVFIPEARAYVVPAPADIGAQFTGKNVSIDGVMALYQRCVHLGCRVPWCQTSQGFECPCHGSKYDGIGEYFAGPAPRNLDRFTVDVDATGNLVIDTGTIVQTPRAPQRIVKYPQGPSCIGAVAAH